MGLILTASCGREAPHYEPGTISVTSDPEGATIILDGQDTGEVTPFLFVDMPANRYVISVVLENSFPNPTSSTVDLHPLEEITRNFEFSSQALTITSSPSGAAIYLDGENSGEVTPATIFRREPGEVDVHLVKEGMYISPSNFTATIVENEVFEVPPETFTLRSKKTVMMEGFSNVNCQGCPEMAADVYTVMHQDGFGLDQVLYCKFSMFWPNFQDPHYLANPDENLLRYEYYQQPSFIPMLTIDGVEAPGPPTALELEPLLRVSLLEEPGFLIDVAADFTNFDVPVTVTLTAMEDVTISDCTLFIALVQSFLEYDTAPGSEGETEFHWLFRDQVDVLPSLDVSLTSGQTVVFNKNLVRGDWDLDTMHVLAFAQENTTRAVLQAGITSTTAHAAASHFIVDNTTTRSKPGDDRP
jgi:PEGA domain